jgi:hypothetical protein
VYRHCIFCHGDLGSNDVIETLPVGRRLAFDAAKARLWVICRKCERWNLTPFDTRWETIEDCERRFRATKMRVSTDNVGLARVSEGLELVRIGEPLRPEMAAWRYGDQFGRRRRKHLLVGGAVIGGVAALQISLAGAGAFGGMWYAWRGVYDAVLDRVGRVKIPAADGRLVTLVPSKARKARLTIDALSNRLTLSVRSGKSIERWHDDDARAIASVVLPRANQAGASHADVKAAVEVMNQANVRDDPIVDLLGRERLARRLVSISDIKKPQRLALEMALHEEEERRALQGEIKLLEARWQEAEEIAAIADSLTLPDSVERRLADLKGERRE